MSVFLNPVLTFIGGPTLLVEIGKVRFLTDPTFDPPGSEYKIGPVRLAKTGDAAVLPSHLPSVDAVLLTHDQHADNLDDAGRAYLPRARSVLTTVSGAARLGGNAVGLAPWRSHVVASADETESVTVTATPARHGPPGSEEISGDVVGFCLEWPGADGALYLSGDTVWFDGMAEVGRRFRVGTAVLFLGGATIAERGPEHVTMTAEEGVQAALALAAEHIVPVHYDGWAHLREGKADVSRAFEAAGLQHKLTWLQSGRSTALADRAAVAAPIFDG